MQAIWYWIGRFLVFLFARLLLQLDVVWTAPLPPGPVILAANHPSTVDPALLTTLIPDQVHILIRGNLFNIPLMGSSMRLSGHIPVITGKGQACLNQAQALLKAGRTVAIFPEGEVSPLEGGFHKPHTGLARLALSTGVPVIPVGIHIDTQQVHLTHSEVDGIHEVGTWYFHGPYAVTIGEPIFPHGSLADHEQVQQVSRQIMHRIIQLSLESAQRIELGGFARRAWWHLVLSRSWSILAGVKSVLIG